VVGKLRGEASGDGDKDSRKTRRQSCIGAMSATDANGGEWRWCGDIGALAMADLEMHPSILLPPPPRW
jgi:hypothetical protein